MPIATKNINAEKIQGNLSINSITATTISATTYQNLPTDINITGGTYSNGTATFTNNTGGTITLTGLTTTSGNSPQIGFFSGSTNLTGSDSLIYSGGTLQIRATGTTSSVVPFRVRNSGNTADLMNINGDGTFSFPGRIVGDTAGLGTRLVFGNAAVMHTQANHVNITGSRIEVDSAQTMLSTNSLQNVRFTSSSGGAPSSIMLNFANAHIHVGGGVSDSLTNLGTNVFSSVNGTAPTSSLTDRFLLYSADRGGTAGRASAHFRSEDGTINVLGDRTGINTSTPQARLHVANADTTLTTGLFSGTGQNILTVIGSGNSTTSPIFTVQGSSGELFSVSDSLVGSLFSVNDISGLPIMEVFSDNTTLWGSYLAPSLNTTTRVIATTGTTNVYSIPTSAYTGAFFDYTVSDGTNLRAGNIMSIWSGTSVNITETQTTDFGNTSGLTFNMVVSSGNAILRTSGTTGNWTVKTIVRSI